MDVTRAGWHCQVCAWLTATHALNGLAATVGTASPRLGSESRWPARSPQELSSLVTNGIRPYSSRHALLCILGWPAKDRLSSFRPRIPACVQYALRLGPNLLMCVGHLYFLDDQKTRRCHLARALFPLWWVAMKRKMPAQRTLHLAGLASSRASPGSVRNPHARETPAGLRIPM